MKITSTLIAGLLLAAPFAATAKADRYPTGAERASVSKTLRANGFVAWRKIERDDGKWEVEDARHRSGKVYDLEIRRGRIIDWDRD